MQNRKRTRSRLTINETPETQWNSAIDAINQVITVDFKKFDTKHANEINEAIAKIKWVAELYGELNESSNQHKTYFELAHICEFSLADRLVDLANFKVYEKTTVIFYLKSAFIFYSEAVYACEKLQLTDRELELHLSCLDIYENLLKLDEPNQQEYATKIEKYLLKYNLRGKINRDYQKVLKNDSLLREYENLVNKYKRKSHPETNSNDDESKDEKSPSKKVYRPNQEMLFQQRMSDIRHSLHKEKPLPKVIELLKQAITDFDLKFDSETKQAVLHEMLSIIADTYNCNEMRLLFVIHKNNWLREIIQKLYELSAIFGNPIAAEKAGNSYSLSILKFDKRKSGIDYQHDKDLQRQSARIVHFNEMNKLGAEDYLRKVLIGHIKDIYALFPRNPEKVLAAFAYNFGMKIGASKLQITNKTIFAYTFIHCAAELHHSSALAWIENLTNLAKAESPTQLRRN